MNKKYIIFAILFGLIFLIFNSSFLTEKFSGTLHYVQPTGSYRRYCNNIFYDGYRLIALCPDINNIRKKSEIHVSDCPTNHYGINTNGELICEK